LNKIIVDSSTIICISEKCLTPVLSDFVKKNNIELIMPSSVYDESVKKPLNIKRFELNALRIKKMISDGIISVAEKDNELMNKTKEILSLANTVFWTKKYPFELLHLGEAEAIALAKKTGALFVGVDERTARMLIESPKRLKVIIEKRNNFELEIDKTALNNLKRITENISFIRSTELMALAFKQGLFCNQLINEFQSLKATLYALKFAGCAISSKEIEDLNEKDLK
jgi:predicted nucleic acid-binding protein